MAYLELFPAINQDQHGLERYRLFCVGRHKPWPTHCRFLPHCRPERLWEHKAAPSIYFLAGAHPLTFGNAHVNVRVRLSKPLWPPQPLVRSYRLYRSDSATQLFISGTASVVGHQSQHKGLADLKLEKR